MSQADLHPSDRAHAAKATGKRRRTILVTGYRGFLGSYIVRELMNDARSLWGVDAQANPDIKPQGISRRYDLRLPDIRFDDILQSARPDVIIHCAGSADVGASFTDPPTDYRNNVESTAFVLESIRRCAPQCKFVLLSSAAVYGNPRHLPVAETERCIPISPYGCHKLLGEQLAEDYARDHSLNIAILRIFSAYGEGLQRQVIHDLCRKFHTADGRTIKILGTGNESRDFVHAEDVARTVSLILDLDLKGTFNAASGIETSIRELVQRIQTTCGNQAEVIFTGETRAGDPLRWQADISRLRGEGFQPKVSLEDGIERYVRWYRAGRS